MKKYIFRKILSKINNSILQILIFLGMWHACRCVCTCVCMRIRICVPPSLLPLLSASLASRWLQLCCWHTPTFHHKPINYDLWSGLPKHHHEAYVPFQCQRLLLIHPHLQRCILKYIIIAVTNTFWCIQMGTVPLDNSTWFNCNIWLKIEIKTCDRQELEWWIKFIFHA